MSATYVTRYTDNVAKSIKEDGVAVVRNVLDEKELTSARLGLKNTLKHLTADFPKESLKVLDLDDKSTYPSLYKLSPLHSMLIQHHSIGHAQFIWDIRQNPNVKKVFEDIWKTSNLLVSYDGLSVHLPQPPNRFGKSRGYYRGNDWFHVDQSFTKKKFECVQGFVSLYDVNQGDATFEYREGSVALHSKFGDKFGITDKTDWYKISKQSEIDFYSELPRRRLLCKAGDMVLWDSRLLHHGSEPYSSREKENIRCVIYVCMMPRRKRMNIIHKYRQRLEELRMTTHTGLKMFPKSPRTYGKRMPPIRPMNPPVLNNLGKRLAGISLKRKRLIFKNEGRFKNDKDIQE